VVLLKRVVVARRDGFSADIWSGANVLRGLLVVRASSPLSAVLWLHIDHNTTLTRILQTVGPVVGGWLSWLFRAAIVARVWFWAR